MCDLPIKKKKKIEGVGKSVHLSFTKPKIIFCNQHEWPIYALFHHYPFGYTYGAPYTKLFVLVNVICMQNMIKLELKPSQMLGKSYM